MEEKDKSFIKKSRLRLKELSDIYYECDDSEFDLRFNELKTYYKFLLESESISNSNKVLYTQELIDCSRYYLKNWVINFLTTAILKIYQKGVDASLIINNDYFLFRFLANKEIIKRILKRFDIINNFNLNYINNKIFYLQESRTLFYDKRNLMEKINKGVKKMNDFLENENFQHRNTLNLSSINDFFYLKNKLMEDKFVELVNNKYFFENVNDKITINDSFRDFLNIFFNIEVDDDKILILDSNEEEVIKNELEEFLFFWS